MLLNEAACRPAFFRSASMGGTRSGVVCYLSVEDDDLSSPQIDLNAIRWQDESAVYKIEQLAIITRIVVLS